MPELGIRVLFMGNNLQRLFTGLWVTVRISLIAVLLSMVFGTFLGLAMTVRNPLVRVTLRIYLEFIRIMPQLVLLFLVYFGLSKAFGINLSGEVSAVLVFTLWGSAEMGDLVRGASNCVPKHQYESGAAIGLNRGQVYRYIILPQILRRLVPPAMNLTTRMIKTTSLVVMIGVVEVLKVAQQIIEGNRYTVPDSALWVYGAVLLLYFLACWPVSLFARHLEKVWKN